MIEERLRGLAEKAMVEGLGPTEIVDTVAPNHPDGDIPLKAKAAAEADPNGVGQHDLGARKDDAGKLRYDLIPMEVLEALARVYTFGAKKYEDNNWKKGIKFSRVIAAMWRHAASWAMGRRDDPETGINHLAHLAWGCFALMYFQNHSRYAEFDDYHEKDLTPVGSGSLEQVSCIRAEVERGVGTGRQARTDGAG